MKNEILWADLSLLIVAIIWGGGFVATKEALEIVQPFYMTFIRFAVAFIIMLLIFHKRLNKITKEDVKFGFVTGFLLFVAFATQSVGLLFTTASNQAFITGSNVVFVPFIFWAVSKKRPDIYSLISVFLCMLGISLLTLQDGLHINTGDALTLFSAVLFAAQMVAVGQYAKKTDPVILTIMQFGFSALFGLVTALLFETPPTTYTNKGVLSLAYIILLSTLVGFLIQSLAQKHTTSTHAAIIICMESVFGAILSVIILNEKFTLSMAAGCLLIFVSIVLCETKLDFLKVKKLVKTEADN